MRVLTVTSQASPSPRSARFSGGLRCPGARKGGMVRRTEMMATASRGKWGCGSLWATLPAPAQPPEDPQAYSPPLPRLLAGLTARIPSASAPNQRRARPTPAPAPRAPHVALGLDPWASPGGGAGLISQSEPLRSAVPPNQRLRGYLAPPTLRPELAPPCRSSSTKLSGLAELSASPLLCSSRPT